MKAALFREYGTVNRITVEEVERPEIRDDQILVKTRAASVNPLDWKILKGQIRFMTGLLKPRLASLGFDVCGEVVETGSNVSSFKKGDRIYAMLGRRGGAFADYVAVPELTAARAPSTLSDSEAAGVPLASLTALQALRDKGKIESGQRVLINGASGGVGTFAVQIAKALGSEVTAVCSGKNAGFVRLLGAETVIDYTREEIAVSSGVYDIVFDAVAKSSFSACRRKLTPGGVYVTTVPAPRDIVYMLLAPLVGRRRSSLIMVKADRADLRWMKRMIDGGKIKPVIDRQYPLAEIAEALTYSMEGHARGKIVVTMEE